MAISRSPGVGEVIQCDFGDDYPRDAQDEVIKTELSVNTRLPPEMVKKRLVVVLNGKMAGGCMVVPVSSSKKRGQSTTTAKFHVPIPGDLIQGHDYFTSDVDRWALAQQVQLVSKDRLNPFHPDPNVTLTLPHALVTRIQRAVVKAINAGSLLIPDATATAPQATAAAPVTHAPTNALGSAFLAAQAKKVVRSEAAQPAAQPEQASVKGQTGSPDGKEAA
jgi:uncharacterized protein YifN (PemK superfamily)